MFERRGGTPGVEARLSAALADRATRGRAPSVLEVYRPDIWAGVELDPEWVERAHDRSLEQLDRGRSTGTPETEPAPASDIAAADPGEQDPDEFAARAARFQAELASDEALLDTARAAEVDIARAQAARARALTAFAARRPVSLDRPDDQVGAAARASRATRPEALRAVSEFCVDEVAVGLSMNPNATGNLMVQSVRLVDRLPGTLAALEAGRIAWGHVLIAVELIAPLSAELRALAEEQLLPRAVGRSPQSWRPIVRRLVMKLDADAITARVAAAVRERKVVVYPAADGMATLCATLPIPVARAVEDVLRRHARNAKGPGDQRSQGERMADCLVDLLLDPTGHGLSPVQAQLTVVASVRALLGGDEPGEVTGDVVPASMVRELASALGLLPAPAGEAHASTAKATARATATATESTADAVADESRYLGAPEDAASDAEPTPTRHRALTALLDTRTLAGTGLAARPTIALTDETTGELLAVTDATGLRRAASDGTGLGPPPETPGYTPTAALDAFVRLRDRRCQFPGCRARPTVCDLDHQHPWLDGGRTAHDNLARLCRHHHRLSHQAPGWALRRTDDGAGLRWQTPTGQVVVTRPTGLASSGSATDPPEPPKPPEPVTEPRSPHQTEPPEEDPPPF